MNMPVSSSRAAEYISRCVVCDSPSQVSLGGEPRGREGEGGGERGRGSKGRRWRAVVAASKSVRGEGIAIAILNGIASLKWRLRGIEM